MKSSRYSLTLFVTGRAATEDPVLLGTLAAEENVELGGHGWDSFRPHWKYRALNKLFGSPHGPGAFQARMIRRTRAAIERATSIAWSTPLPSVNRPRNRR